MKKEYQNPLTGIENATTSTVLMGSPYSSDYYNGNTGGILSVPGRKVYI